LSFFKHSSAVVETECVGDGTRIRHERIECLPAPPQSESAGHLFPVLVSQGSKAEFLSYMRSRDILCGEHYPILIPDQRVILKPLWGRLSTGCQPAADWQSDWQSAFLTLAQCWKIVIRLPQPYCPTTCTSARLK